MTTTLFAMIFVTLLGCNEKGPGTSRADGSPSLPQRMNCQAQKDAFKCLREACAEARGLFNEDNKSCSCPDKQIFTAQSGGSCIVGELHETNDMTFQSNTKGVHFYLLDRTSNGTKLSESEMAESLRGISAPIFPGTSTMMIFRTGKDFMKIQNAFNSGFTDTLTFGMPNTYLSGVNINGGIYNSMVDRNQLIRILPSHQRIDLTTTEQTQILDQALSLSQQSFNPHSIYSFSNLGCAEICIAKEVLIENSELKVARTRVYSGGNPLNDQLSIYNKKTHVTEVSLVLFNNQVSHYILRENGQYNLYANDGEKLAMLGDYINLEQGYQQKAAPVGKPVIIFEDGYDSKVDTVALRGPFEESYYGWFNSKDAKPYLYGKTMIEWGEDYSNAGEHALEVSKLASANFQRAVIPFSSAALLNGDFESRFPMLPNEPLVASVSLAFPYERMECSESNIAKAIKRSAGKILWTIGAGNSGRQLQSGSLISCPQIIRLPNTLIIASTGGYGSLSLSSSSTYGEESVDIAENGCRFDSPNCGDSKAATSYAAPRAARSIANMMKLYSQFSPEQIRAVVLLTVRVPYRNGWSVSNSFLPVASGGILDTQAAAALLQYMKDTGIKTIKSLTDSELVKALIQTKMDQYNNLDSDDVEDLIKEQIKRIKKNYKEIL